MSLLPSGSLGSVVQEVSVGRVTSAPGTRSRGLHSSQKGEPSPPRVPRPASALTFLRFAVRPERTAFDLREESPPAAKGGACVPFE